MKIAISGASGFIGSYLSGLFTRGGYKVVPLDRSLFQVGAEYKLKRTIAGCNVVINLAGAPINHRWTKKYQQELYNSRIGTTCKIVHAINTSPRKPELFISASAVGVYPSCGCYNEYASIKGSSFLSALCSEWEDAARQISPDVRMAITRFGVVLSTRGGVLGKMVLPAKTGFATVIGDGSQSFSWINIEDLGRAMNYIIENESLNGAVNLVAPERTTNKEFTQQTADHYHSLVTIHMPKSFFRFILGKSSEIVNEGQCVAPAKLLQYGFKFKTETLKEYFDYLKVKRQKVLLF